MTALRALLAAGAVLLAAAPGAAAAGALDAPTRTVRADGHTIGYRTIGTGRPLVLVQGLGGTMDGWDPAFVDGLAAQGRRVILLDNEGAGKSTARTQPLTIRRMGADVAALIRALGLRRADVAGWSMGGMIVQSLAVRHPRVVRRVVLMASAPGDGKATLPSQEALAALASDDPAGLLGGLFAEGNEAVRDGYLARIARRRAFDPLVAPAVRSRQLGAAGGWLLGQDADGARVRRLRMPVLVGSGALDPLLPAANQRHLAKAIPRATLVQYPDASHGFFIQHRRRFLRTVNRFLD